MERETYTATINHRGTPLGVGEVASWREPNGVWAASMRWGERTLTTGGKSRDHALVELRFLLDEYLAC